MVQLRHIVEPQNTNVSLALQIPLSVPCCSKMKQSLNLIVLLTKKLKKSVPITLTFISYRVNTGCITGKGILITCRILSRVYPAKRLCQFPHFCLILSL